MHADPITAFYTAFTRGDGEAMAACYSGEIAFDDPAFGRLTGQDAGDMWRMLCGASGSPTVTFQVVQSRSGSTTVRWTADYAFGARRRPVHNEVVAHLVVRDGLIVEHHDVFDFPRWARQALGLPGLLLGWSPLVQRKVRAGARARLAAFQARA
ncbi:nuclear transport factor 2 family protein [Actinotalea sp.]|uniref:nuclear transport factor 2 family protein n=1 Tax=Actinotalea sp. TaxID=1872145 RepID=UPI0035671C30